MPNRSHFLSLGHGLFKYETQDGPRYAVRITWRNTPWQRQGFRTKTGAASFRAKIKSEQHEQVFWPEKYRVRQGGQSATDILTNYHPTKPTNWERATERAKRQFWDEQRFYTFWWIALKPYRLHQVTLDLLNTLLAGKYKLVGPATRNHYMKWIKKVFRAEHEGGRLTVNPAAGLKKLKEPKAPDYFYSETQFKALCKELGPIYADWVRLDLLTGMRRHEFFSLKKAWINLEAGLILIPEPKAGEPQYAHLTEEATIIVKRIMARSNSPWLFPSNRNPRQHITPGSWYTKVFKPARDRAKIPKEYKFHTLRHTFPSRLAAAGVSDLTIAEAGRWKSMAIVKRYTHHHRKVIKEALEKAFPKR